MAGVWRQSLDVRSSLGRQWCPDGGVVGGVVLGGGLVVIADGVAE